MVDGLERLTAGIDDALELLELAREEQDEAALAGIAEDVARYRREVEQLEFRRMFSGELDGANCFVDIQAGSGGTEAQDWGEMLLRMYLRWCEAHGFKAELVVFITDMFYEYVYQIIFTLLE